MAELKRLTKRKCDELGIPFALVADAAEHVEEHAPPLTLQFSFSDETARTVAKMACNLLALNRKSLFMTPSFDSVRTFVLTGGEPQNFVVFTYKLVDIATWNKAIGPLDHVIVVKGDAATRRVQAMVVLFGHIQFSVLLATNANIDASFATSYRLDQLGRTDRVDDRRDVRLHVRDFGKVASTSASQRLQTIGTGLRNILRVVMRMQEDAFLGDITRRSLVAAFGEPDGTRQVTQEMVDAFSTDLATRFTDYLVRTGRLDSVVANLERRGLI